MAKPSMEHFGITILNGLHPDMRRLKRTIRPTEHGHKVWDNSWLIIDYLNSRKDLFSKKVVEAGCGWAIPSLFLARIYNCEVLATDIDPQVEPFLELNCQQNNTKVRFKPDGYSNIDSRDLAWTDLLILSDSCYSEDLIHELDKLVQRASKYSPIEVILTDPGRWPFLELVERIKKKYPTTELEWEIKEPRPAKGHIVRMVF